MALIPRGVEVTRGSVCFVFLGGWHSDHWATGAALVPHA